MPRTPEKQNDKRDAILDFIVKYKAEHDGVAPTVREIQKATGISSTSVIDYHMLILERDGKIRTERYQPRFIEVVGAEWIPPA